MSGTKNNLNFNNFAGYYTNLYHSNYGGFDWFNMMELNGSMIDNVLDYCDTGYNNALHGRGEGVTVGNGSAMYTYASTFNLKSGVFASAWEVNQPVYIDTWANGTEKASIEVHLSQMATKIDFSKYGTDFQDINAITIWPVNKGGTGGSTCTYGHPTYGYQVAFDNLKITLNSGKGPHSEHGRPAFFQAFAHHHATHTANPFAALAMANPDGHTAATGLSSSHHAPGQTGSGYHAELMSLDGAGHHDTGLTSQFALPLIEHFGL